MIHNTITEFELIEYKEDQMQFINILKEENFDIFIKMRKDPRETIKIQWLSYHYYKNYQNLVNNLEEILCLDKENDDIFYCVRAAEDDDIYGCVRVAENK